MSVFYDLNKTPRNILNQAIVRAIVSENNGALFDPSDLSTLYQDSAGSTPVTAVEQPVGLMLDKSRGMILGPELVPQDYLTNSAVWSVINGTAQAINGKMVFTANGVGQLAVKILKSVALNKTLRASLSIDSFDSGLGSLYDYATGTFVKVISSLPSAPITSNAQSRNDFELIAFLSGGTPAAGASFSIDNLTIKEIYGNHATQSITASRPTLSARKNVLLATETLATQSVTTLAATYTLSFTGTGSVTLSGTATGTLTGTGADRVSLTFTPTAGNLTLTVSGSVTKAQLELGAVAGPYQRVNTATDYDTDERYFPKYLQFSSAVAIDDFLNLPYMSLYNGGAASVIAARNAVSQSTDTYIISERSTTDADPKYFPSRQLASGGNMDAYISDDTAAVVLDTVGSAFGGAADKVIRSVVDTGSNLKLYKNGSLAADDNYTRSGTLTLNNTTIGASVSTTTSNYASMKLYGLIITKSALTDAQRIACERHLSRKSGVIL